ncbi:hypothetical protein MY10362_008964 [Beauveria mimosiformis]
MASSVIAAERKKVKLSYERASTAYNTGERPYKCANCNTSFYRNDILKRHFQKCSIRNPTGASHLSHPVPVQDGMNGMPSDQRQLSRSSSMG